MTFFKKEKTDLFKSLFTAYCILFVHIFLLAGIGVAVVLFKGIYHYLPWVMGGLGLIILSAAFFVYRRLSRNTTEIKDILAMPEFRDRTVEIKLMGGLASFTISPEDPSRMRISHQPSLPPENLLTRDTADNTEHKILKLTALFEKNLITEQEFETQKQKILQG